MSTCDDAAMQLSSGPERLVAQMHANAAAKRVYDLVVRKTGDVRLARVVAHEIRKYDLSRQDDTV